jgi:metallo-beta-lactamase class B
MRLLSLLLPLLAAAPSAPADTAPIQCTDCADWNQPQAPFRVYGNTYYVGVRGLSAVLIDTGKGLILLDGALPQSAPRIAANLRTLGFDIRDVRWILGSHAHFDHVGGVAALQRMSGAKVAASPDAARALRTGTAVSDDPQAGLGARCADMVYADSLTAVSAPRFRFGGDAGRVEAFRRGIERVRTLPCDVLIATHPGATRLFAQRAASEAEGRAAFIDPGACRAYAERADQGLSDRLKREAEGLVE